MHATSSSDSPAPCSCTGLLAIAGLSLLLAIFVESTLAIAYVYLDSMASDLRFGLNRTYWPALGILAQAACLGAISPLVLVDRHRVFCGLLASVHFVAGWTIQICAFSAIVVSNSQFLTTTAIDSFLLSLWTLAGLWYAVAFFATTCGWTVTRRLNGGERPSLSIRGMLVATAVVAFLIASPRISPTLTVPIVRFISAFWSEGDSWSATIASMEISQAISVRMMLALVQGAMFATTLASGLWINQLRWAWSWLAISAGILACQFVLFRMLYGVFKGHLTDVIIYFFAYFLGGLFATLHMRLWQQFGWQVVRVRRGSSSSLVSVSDCVSKTFDHPASDGTD